MKKNIFLFFILFLPCSLLAQIPGGLILWLKGDIGIVQQSGKISQWADQSGLNNSVFQSDTSSQPVLIKNVLNGHSIVKFLGNDLFVGPSIFPLEKDYTIVGVVRIDDSTNINNIISGIDHALFFGSNSYPAIVHADFNFLAVSRLKLDSNFAIVSVRYSNVNGQVKFYVNGQSGDSLYIPPNKDSIIYIGSFRGGYTLKGSIAELALFDRQLSEDERRQFEESLRVKYAIPLGKLIPKPDSTFTSLPANLQLYPRSSDDSAIVPIEGTIYAPGFDSIGVEVFKNDAFTSRLTEPLHYQDNKASFSFHPKIHAELSEHHFIVHLKNEKQDTIIADRNNITSGDVYFVCGESNSTFGFYNVPFQNEFCRTFGVNFSQNIRDTQWNLSTAYLWGNGPSVNGWGLMLQKHFLEEEHIPTCIIDGGLSGTILIHHLRDTLYPLSLQTIYGRLLYRSQKANIAKAVKAIIWYHGELDFVDQYYKNFKTLYNNWHEDFPNLQKCYAIQLRPAYCVNRYDQPLRELFRTIQDSLPGIVSVSSTMFPHQDGCHFHDDGFGGIADQLFPLIARDFYHSTDTIGIASPNITKAYFSTSDHSEIALIFSPHNSGIHATNDTTVNGIFAKMKDYFYPDDDSGKIQSIRFSGDTIFLTLYSPSNAKSISDIPDRYYNGSDSVFYEGPWLTSSRGIGALIFYHFPIDEFKSDTNAPANPGDLTLDVVPNPVQNQALLKYNLPKEAFIQLSLYNVLGQKMMTLDNENKIPGSHEYVLDTGSLPAGEYFCRLQAGDKTIGEKIIVKK